MPNKVYAAPETPIVFKDSGGDAVITLQNLAYPTGNRKLIIEIVEPA